MVSETYHWVKETSKVMTLANIDKLNEPSRAIVPLEVPDNTELIKQLYDSGVSIGDVIGTYSALDDLYSGQAREREQHEWDHESG